MIALTTSYCIVIIRFVLVVDNDITCGSLLSVVVSSYKDFGEAIC